jgi:hypothetical protein
VIMGVFSLPGRYSGDPFKKFFEGLRNINFLSRKTSEKDLL